MYTVVTSVNRLFQQCSLEPRNTRLKQVPYLFNTGSYLTLSIMIELENETDLGNHKCFIVFLPRMLRDQILALMNRKLIHGLPWRKTDNVTCEFLHHQ